MESTEDGGSSWQPGNHQVFRRRPLRQAAVFYLVRHAEKIEPAPVDAPRDPSLTERGHRRAAELARLLSAEGLTAVYSSDYQRTRQTAAPVAAALGVEVQIYDAGDLESLAEQLRRAGGRALVVGHSNTTPQLAALLDGEAGPPIDEAVEFDRLYVLHVGTDGVTTSMLRYGAELPVN
jgi:broad specificity phosphatase PhoE